MTIARKNTQLAKTFPSWILDKQTCTWISPVAYPNDGNNYVWNEETQNWVNYAT